MFVQSAVQTVIDRVVPPSLYRVDTGRQQLARLHGNCASAASTAAAAQTLKEAAPALLSSLMKRLGNGNRDGHAAAIALKVLNTLLAKHQMSVRDTQLIAKPVGLVVDPSNMCQLACPGCVHSATAQPAERFVWPKGTLEVDRFTALMEQFGPWAIAVYFCDYGEPLLNRKTPAMIRLAKQYRLHASLSTSLSIKHFDADSYVESGLDFMALSIDGATQPVYQRYRRNGDLELVLSNIRKLLESRRRLGRTRPAISWNFLAFEHNQHEIPLAIRTATQLGVDQFRVVEPFDVGWDDPEIRAARVRPRVIHLQWRQALRSAARGEDAFPHPLLHEQFSQALASPWRIPESAAPTALGKQLETPTGHTCHWLYKNMVMDATGRVMP